MQFGASCFFFSKMFTFQTDLLQISRSHNWHKCQQHSEHQRRSLSMPGSPSTYVQMKSLMSLGYSGKFPWRIPETRGKPIYSMVCSQFSNLWVCGLFYISKSTIYGFESHSRHICLCACLFCVCAVLCVGCDFATGWSLVQGVHLRKKITKLKNKPGPNKGL
jgi:hypothetical protein